MTVLWMWICCLLLLICGMTRGDSGDTTTVQCSSGEPHCPKDYAYPINSCRFNTPITCTRYVWNREETRSHSRSFPIAVPKNAGMAICVVVKPTKDTRFTIDLTSGKKIINHFDARKNYIHTDTLITNQFKDDKWDHQAIFPSKPWPFSIGSEATVVIFKPPHRNKGLAYVVDSKAVKSKVVAAWHMLWTPLQQATHVSVWGDADVIGVNTLCTKINWRPA